MQSTYGYMEVIRNLLTVVTTLLDLVYAVYNIYFALRLSSYQKFHCFSADAVYITA